MIHCRIKERMLIKEEYNRTRSYLKTQNAFRIQLLAWSVSSDNSEFTIHYYCQNLSIHGAYLNRNKGNSDKPRPTRIIENIALVQNMLQHNPKRASCRRNGLGVSSSTFNRITQKELRWRPYWICVRHELTEGNFY